MELNEYQHFLETMPRDWGGAARHINSAIFARDQMNVVAKLHAEVGGPAGDVRWMAVSKWGYSVPTEQALRRIVEVAEGRGILEVGAGPAYWLYLLKQLGCTVTATDAKEQAENKYGFAKQWLPVEKLEATEAILAYPDHLLFLSWPDDYNSEEGWSDKALDVYEGDTLFYVGEGWGGCTGSDRFHKLIADWPHREYVDLPHWSGIHDQLHIVKR